MTRNARSSYTVDLQGLLPWVTALRIFALRPRLMSELDMPEWPRSPVPNTTAWATRCCAQFLLRDPGLDLADAKGLANEMSAEHVWRRMQPEAAADELFSPMKLRPIQ